MTTTSTGAIFGFGPVADQGDGVVGNAWYRQYVENSTLGPNDDQQVAPMEMGGSPVPKSAFKNGYVVGGGLSMYPRMYNSLGWLLYAGLGACTTVAGSGNVETHEFTFDPNNLSALKWLGIRDAIPSDGATDNYVLGRTYNDVKITQMTFAIGNEGLGSLQLGVLGCDFELSEDPAWATASGSGNGWAADGEYEPFASIPINVGPVGYISSTAYGGEIPIIGGSLSLINQPAPIREEKVYGNPALPDITIVSRRAVVDFVCKWQNPDLYRKVLTASATGTAWSATPFTGNFALKMVSGANITGEAEPYSLLWEAETVLFALQGQPALSAGDTVTMRFQGTVLDTPGSDYIKATLSNLVAGYTWPT